MNKYDLTINSLYIVTPGVQAACVQHRVHWHLHVDHDLSNWGQPGAVAGDQLPAALELLSSWPMSLLLRKCWRIKINNVSIHSL